MPTLYVYPAAPGVLSLSPFCTKSMVWLKLAGVRHQVKVGSPQKSPTGKLPTLKTGGQLIADSGRIQRWAMREHGDPLDASLTPEQHAIGHVVRRTVEEHLYWALVYLRWQREDGWAIVKPQVQSFLPPLLRPAVGLVRRRALGQVQKQGLGLHDDAEITLRACADLDAIESLIGQGPFLFGAAPSSYDVIVYAFVTAITALPLDHEICRHARTLRAVAHLIEGIDARLEALEEA